MDWHRIFGVTLLDFFIGTIYKDFRLYAVCTREPQKLASTISLHFVKDGVYEIGWGSRTIRIIVLSQIPRVPRNAIWLMFSGIAESVQYGASHYHWRRTDNSAVVHQLYKQYQMEYTAMPYTLQDFYREFTKENVDLLTPQERVAGLSPDDLLKNLSVDEILKRLSPDDMEAYLKKLRETSKSIASA